MARVTEFTDPGCAWAWSAEPAKRRIRALYPDLPWEVRLVGLAERGEDREAKGFTPEAQQAEARALRERYGMPIDDGLRPRAAGTVPACRAVVATRVHAPQRTDAVLRALRLRHFGGELLDEPATLDGAAADAGITRLEAWMADPAVEAALREDMEVARTPAPAALVLHHKLERDDGRWQLGCPSWVVSAGGREVVVPGFQPVEVYEVVLANLLPEVERAADPTPEALLASAPGEPLATREVAVACGLSDGEAREQLATVAEWIPLGQSEVWVARDVVDLAQLAA